MEANQFLDAVQEATGVDAFFGVPDSLLRALTDEIVERHGFSGAHVVAADEGGAVGLAAGHYLATGKPALVYMQNSGIGNAVNPICSLLNEEVYAIPALFVVGWRGEPGVHDEPQHVFQGRCSKGLLNTVGLSAGIVEVETTPEDLAALLKEAGERLEQGKSAALLVRKGAITRNDKHAYVHDGPMTREQALHVALVALPDNAAIVSTTGKLSRELFEAREAAGQGHERDFLTVGSMGHSSMIGLGVAQAQPQRPVAVLDGDGACLMHTGAFAIIGQQAPVNYVHVLFNNAAHESVGGMPTASSSVDWAALATACGYASAVAARSEEELTVALTQAAQTDGPHFIEARVSLFSRADLGRPTTTAYENGRAFMRFLSDNDHEL